MLLTGGTMKLSHFDQIELQPVNVEGAAGTKIRWLIAQKDGAPNFALRMFEVEPGGHTPYHTHAWEHEVYCLQGQGVLVFEGNEYPFRADDSMFIDPNKMHQFKNTGADVMKFLCIIPHESNYTQDTVIPKAKPVNPFAKGKANNC
jgi:quercetin dioxygenase-like cupin family protein